MMRRAFKFDGRISTIFTQRGSVSGMSDVGRYHTSWCSAAIVYSEDLITRSGGPKPSRTPCHSLSVTSGLAGGMSFGLPSGAPASTQRTIVSICASLSHGGIWRVITRCLIDLAHGRALSNVMSDIGAIEFG